MARKWHAQPMDAKKEERMSVEVNCFFSLCIKYWGGHFDFLSHFRMKNEKFGQTNAYDYEANKFWA